MAGRQPPSCCAWDGEGAKALWCFLYFILFFFIDFYFLLFLKIFYLFIFREKEGEGGGEGEKHRGEREASAGCLPSVPGRETNSTPQACVLTRNQTGDLSICRKLPGPLGHSAWSLVFLLMIASLAHFVTKKKLKKKGNRRMSPERGY